MRQLSLRPEAADVVDAFARGALDLGDHVAVEEGRLAQSGLPAVAHQYAPALSIVKL